MTASASGTDPGCTVKQALLDAASLGMARLDAQLLLLYVLGRNAQDRAWLIAHDTDVILPEALARFDALCRRRAQGEPVAYLVGEKEFHGLALAVDSRVLVPRADTETLVEWALDVLRGELAHTSSPRVLDLGTGSGAIALAIAHVIPSARVTAVDASADALAVAQGNAARLALQIEFIQSDWLGSLEDRLFDLIVSNPPYVADDDVHLHALRHEPVSALTSGPDGLRDLRRIAIDAPRNLAPGGALLMEHGWDQAVAVRKMLEDAGFDKPASRRDLADIERCSGAFFHTRG